MAGAAGQQAAWRIVRSAESKGEEEKCHECWTIHRKSPPKWDALAHADSSFRSLLGEKDWQQLPLAVQRRFGRDLAPGESMVYLGEVASTERTIVGWIWVQMLRVVGAPMPTGILAHAPSNVVVTASSAHAQCWTRIYHSAGRLPQVIRSMKRFAGPTGLEERIGGGIVMALAVTVESHTLVFRSAGYHWRCSRIRLPLPVWITPGRVEVRHREEQEGRFSFVLTVVHPWWGRIFRQVAYFKDAN